ncbi:sialyltransferase-like protein 5 isoform X2 [Physcomitrium patens]|uniref:sialyltransferase-like protein 5 isoform X2 n=1 Tax=Physcomitrium patens TaxID=3218 RepID=UPI000D1596D7|nr:sialyltransferase-like protein 5 isoform X2 [Physcomitrium patens]|eukprot:XP_024394904.1 sialyltransferase-like protein 5 isoform X2 [Physcomitrella patens]
MKRSRQVASRRVASRRVKWFLEATQASTRLWLWLWPPHPQHDDDDDDDEQDLAGVAMARITSISLLLPLAILSSFLLVATWFLFSPASAGQLRSQRGLRSVEILWDLQRQLSQCVAANGLGLRAEVKNHCQTVLKFPKETNSTWFNRQFKVYEPLEYLFNVCDTLLLWEQFRNMTTILTREYLDARPNGWLEYAPTRISQFAVDRCHNKSSCEDELQLVLPNKPPFKPRQFATCAVVGNSGDLLLAKFGSEIDAHEVVLRDNEAPVNKTYDKHVGRKRTFRLIGEGVARNLREVVKGNKEVVIIKSKIHRDFNAMIKEIPNPVYLFQGVEFRRGAKGTGIKSIELAVSMCDVVDIYGFTVDPGYADWTRYFSAPRRGHNPLQGRAYYQLLECLGILKIHSPMREKSKQNCSVIPSREALSAARVAAFQLKRIRQSDEPGPFSACGVWAAATKTEPFTGASDMSTIRRTSNYKKWELLRITDLRNQAQKYQIDVGGVSFYKIDGNKLDSLLCVRH